MEALLFFILVTVINMLMLSSVVAYRAGFLPPSAGFQLLHLLVSLKEEPKKRCEESRLITLLGNPFTRAKENSCVL